MLVAYLVQTKRINPTAIDADENQSLDSVSVDVVPAFQTLLAFLADVDLCNSALNFTVASISSRVKEFESGKVDCHWHDRGMLLHPIKNRSNGSVVNHNAFWRISNSCLSQLQEEARQSLLELQLRPNTCFQRLFIEDKFFFQRYDYYFHVPALIDNITVAQDLGNVLLHCEAREYVSSIGSILLEQALGDRVRAIHSFVRYVDDSAKEALIASTSHLPSCDLVDSPKGSWIVTFGVSVDPERGFRRVERADQVKLIPRSSIVVDGCLKVASVVDFQAFWGERCQLRRFQDGTITEAVFWDDESLSIKDEIKASASADAITERIVQYTFTRHLIGIVEGSVSRVVAANSTLLESVMKPFDGLTQNSYKVTKPSAGAVSVSEDLTRKAVESLDRLRSLLTSSLSSLPLSFDTIAAVSPELRYTALVPAAPHPVVLCSSQSESSEIRTIWRAYAGQTVSLVVKPVVVLAKLESSGKWPFHAAAIQRLKLAILLQARKELSKKHNVGALSSIIPLYDWHYH